MNGNVAQLAPSGAEVFNFPMKLEHGTGAPTRFYAIHGVDKTSGASYYHPLIYLINFTIALAFM